LQRQAEESQRILQQLQPLRGRLDGRMLDLVRRDLARNQEALKSQEAKDLQKLFEQPSE
jgi:hypothetical protein